MDAGDVVSGVDRARGGHRRVDAAGHRGQHSSRQRPPESLTRTPAAARSADRRRPGQHASGRAAEPLDVGRGRCDRARSAAPTARRSRSSPIASSTWLGSGTPAEQADPVEQSMPAASSSISSASARQPGNGEAGHPGQPRRPGRRAVHARVRDGGRTPATSSSRSARAALDSRLEPADRHLDRGGEPGHGGHVQGPGPDVALLPPAVQHRGQRRRRAGPAARRPRPAAELVRGEGEQVQAAGGEVDRHVADRLHGVAVRRGRRARAARAATAVDRLQGADLVVGPHHDDQGGASGRRRRSQRRPRRRRPVASTGEPVDLGALGRRPARRTESSTAWCSTAEATSRSRPSAPPAAQ